MSERAQWYYLSQGGDVVGPLSHDEMRLAVDARSISGNTFVWCEDLKNWTPLSASPLARARADSEATRSSPAQVEVDRAHDVAPGAASSTAQDPTDALPAKVRIALKRFDRHRRGCLCFECGYAGMMGVRERVLPWYGNLGWGMLILVLSWFTPGRFGLFAMWAALVWMSTLDLVECPSCGASLSLKRSVF